MNPDNVRFGVPFVVWDGRVTGLHPLRPVPTVYESANKLHLLDYDDVWRIVQPWQPRADGYAFGMYLEPDLPSDAELLELHGMFVLVNVIVNAWEYRVMKLDPWAILYAPDTRRGTEWMTRQQHEH